jgi:hypothetical protein
MPSPLRRPPRPSAWPRLRKQLVGLVSNPQTTPTAMLYHPGTNTWTSTGTMTTGRENQTATLLQGGQVLMAGGTLFDHPHVLMFLASAELYTP